MTASYRPLLRTAGEGEHNAAFGLPRTFIVRAEDSAGALSVWIEVVPHMAGPPLHVHRREHKVLEVLEGTLLVQCGDVRAELAAGAFVLVPPGTPHAFRNPHAAPARMVVTLTPGGGEEFFREVQAQGLLAPHDMSAVAALGARYGIEFVGPPLRA